MRLLERNNDEFRLAEFFGDDIPPYAILSHRWGAEEVTFEDLNNGTCKNMTGYSKIQFCWEKARQDKLQYFWVDTCCINKSNNTELAEAINSMFRWYRNATKCYVYLVDVSRPFHTDNKPTEPWDTSFRKSQWFTRGWTLQELLAPASVEFFTKEGELLGNKTSLERQICEISRIPVNALRGNPLSEFSVNERMSWAASRKTTRKEDQAYSLLGIFNVYMPLIYGEGKEKALKRLREEVEKDSKDTEKLLTETGIQREDFKIPLSLSNILDIEYFVGRESELLEMHKTLSSDGSRRRIVLYGLGGIGKTQLSIAYAKRYKDSYSAIFWLNIKDEDSLKQSFVKVAKQISRIYPSAIPLIDFNTKENLDEVLDSIKAWLSQPNNTRWLMIYDNYDNPKLPTTRDPAAVDIQKFLPESYQGSVIITTRSSQVRIGNTLRICKLREIGDSLEILSSTSRRDGLRSDPDATRLAQELDGLPLALATAGAYLDQSSISLFDYLRLYKESWAQLQESSPELSSYEDKKLYSTWQISFQHVKQQNDLSAKLLCFWAYFDSQDIWLELLQHSDSDDPNWVRELAKDEVSFHDTVRVLSNHGLVEADTSSVQLTESRGYSMHGCVHSWTIHVLNKVWDFDLAMLAVKLIGSHIPEEQTTQSWLTERRLFQHAARCSYLFVNGLVPNDRLLSECYSLAYLYRSQGKLIEAEQMLQRALQGYEKAGGPEHTSTLSTVNNLGAIYSSQGKLLKADQMYQRSLQGKEKVLGPEHESTLNIFNNLGIIYKEQGKLVEAEQMYWRALQGKEETWGPGHVSTLDTVNNLGNLYKIQGKFVEAEQMYQRALQGNEKVFGLRHASTLNTVNNLGALYHRQDKLVEAEQMYQRSLQGFEEALGTAGIITYIPALTTILNLGSLYESLRHTAMTRSMYSKALIGYEKVFGPDHSETQTVRDHLRDLNTVEENETLVEPGEPVEYLLEE